MLDNRLLFIISVVFGAVALLLVCGSLYLGVSGNSSYEQPAIIPRSSLPPPHAFASKTPVDSTKLSFMQLDYAPPQLRVPNLSSLLSFHGMNQRPDASGDRVLYFTLGNAKELIKARPKESIFLTVRDGVYAPSENNQPTDLWFTASSQGGKALVSVKVKNEEGKVSEEPKSSSQLILTEKPVAVQAGAFSVGKFRADSALLIRQAAKWYGKDLFLVEHGGDEYAAEGNKQRIQFGEGVERYAVYLEPGDYAVYKDGRWMMPVKGQETQAFPLLKLLKADDKVLSFELYAPGGGQKLVLNVVKSSDPLPAQTASKDFAFIGARTKTHFLFKIAGNREMVAVGDWFLLTPEGWQKIKKVKQVDQFVAGELSGPLLVIQEIGGVADGRYLQGMIYSPGRSQTERVDLALQAQVKKEAPVKEEPAPEEEVTPPAEEMN